jgi:NADH:ubiquinone oxidoreductase subunit H
LISSVTLLLAFPIVFLISLLFEGMDRKVHARMQNRIGPPIIQPFYDYIKLFNKERIIPETAVSVMEAPAPTPEPTPPPASIADILFLDITLNIFFCTSINSP